MRGSYRGQRWMQDVVVGLWGGGGPSTGLAGYGESSFSPSCPYL